MGSATHCSLLFLSFVTFFASVQAVRIEKKIIHYTNAFTDVHYPCEFKTCISTGRALRCLGEFQECEQEFQQGWCSDIEGAVNTSGLVYGWDNNLTLIIAEAYGMCSGEYQDSDLEELWKKYENYVDGDGPCTFSSCLASADLEACKKQSSTCFEFARKLKGLGMSDAVDVHEQIDMAGAALRVHSGDESLKIILAVLEKTDQGLEYGGHVQSVQDIMEPPAVGLQARRAAAEIEEEAPVADDEEAEGRDDESDARKTPVGDDEQRDDENNAGRAPVADDERDEEEEGTAQPRWKPCYPGITGLVCRAKKLLQGLPDKGEDTPQPGSNPCHPGLTGLVCRAKKLMASKWGQSAEKFTGRDDEKNDRKVLAADDEMDDKEEDTAQPRSGPVGFGWDKLSGHVRSAKEAISSKWGQFVEKFKGGAP